MNQLLIPMEVVNLVVAYLQLASVKIIQFFLIFNSSLLFNLTLQKFFLMVIQPLVED